MLSDDDLEPIYELMDSDCPHNEGANPWGGQPMKSASDCAVCINAFVEKAVAEERELVQGFTPTVAGVNGLPDALRKYIHDLETRCDPAGDVAKLTLTMDENRLLRAEVESYRNTAEVKVERLSAINHALDDIGGGRCIAEILAELRTTLDALEASDAE